MRGMSAHSRPCIDRYSTAPIGSKQNLARSQSPRCRTVVMISFEHSGDEASDKPRDLPPLRRRADSVRRRELLIAMKTCPVSGLNLGKFADLLSGAKARISSFFVSSAEAVRSGDKIKKSRKTACRGDGKSSPGRSN
jgi:hypothetical protein